MPENEVALFETLPVAITEKEAAEEIKGGDWLPRIQINDPGSDLTQQDIVKGGNFALIYSKDEAEDLTSEFDCIVMDATWKALDLSSQDEPMSVFDKDTDEFKRIAEQSEIRDSGCMWGMEFLIWISSIGKYATYFCSNKTARRESKNINRLVGHPATLRTKYIKTKKYSWYGPKVTACSTPFDIPAKDDLVKEVKKYRESMVPTEVEADEEVRDR